MFKVSNNYKNEIGKLGGRSFVSKVVIRDKQYNDDNIIDMSLNESVNPGDNFSLGSVASNTFEINLIDVDNNVIFEEAIVKPYIGLELDNKIEYIPLGVFTVDDVAIKDKKVKLECVDNMIKLERAYFSDLKYPANINEVLKEICKKSNISCKSVLPNYSIDEIKGYSFRQTIGIIATLSGCFARFNRLGELEIISYEDTNLRITPDTFFKFETNDKDYIVGKITAKKGEKTFSKGSNTEIIIDNPVITENIVNDLYNKFKDFTYRPYTLIWQGNPAVQAGDKVVISDVNGKEYNTLIMEQKLIYNGGIKSELKASGKTESSDKFDSKGSITQAMENYSIEQANIKKALIQKASIDSLDAIDARINNLYAQDLTVLNAKIRDLQSTKISTIEFNALESKLQHALIGKADINELNVAVERVKILEGKTLSVENQLAGNLTAKNFKANSITAGSGIIAEGAIGSAQISDLELNKLRAGDISTSKFRIISANGSIQIVGNQILVNRDNINRVILGEYKKQDTTSDYGLLIRAKDGKTVMIDSEGVHNAGITDGAINNNKVADNANIAGNKLDINSVIREVNGATETIKGTRVQVGDRTLDIELSTQNNTITEHDKELSAQKASIQALDKALKLKVDEQVYKYSIKTINNNVSTINSNLSKATTELNLLKSEVSSKVNKIDIDKTVKEIEDKIKLTSDKISTAESSFTQKTNEIKANVSNLESKTTTKIINAKNDAIKESRSIPDTRNDNQTPDWYMKNYPFQTITEFKFARVVKIPNASNNYGTLETKVPWSNYSGGYPTQIFRSSDYPTYQRHGLNNTDWSEWEQIEDTQGSQSKADSALNNAKTYTNAQITTVNTRVSNAESSINVLKGQISTKVSQSDIDKTVNNIQIGGRNLVINSNNLTKWNKEPYAEPSIVDGFNRITRTGSSTDSRGVYIDIPVMGGQEYTLSFKTGTCNLGYVGIGSLIAGNNNWNYYNGGYKTLESNTKKSYSFTTKSEETKIRLYFNTAGNTPINSYVEVKEIKIEIGNKATDWTPAPEDVNQEIKDNITTVTTKINTVESTLTQKTNNINAAVSSVQSILNTKADGSTVSSMQSQLSSLNIGLNGIKLEVANKTDKGSIISAINQSAENISINASKINLNGATTFAKSTGLKAIEINNSIISFFDWEGSERSSPVGSIYSTRTARDARKPGIAIGHEEKATFDIIFKKDNKNYSFMTFDKDNILGNKVPITINEDISLNSSSFWLSNSKINNIYESREGNFCMKTKHGLKILDIDSGKYIIDLGSNEVNFGTWKGDYYYTRFFPGGFRFNSGDGTPYFWVDSGSSDICTKAGVNMIIQGSLSVRGSKNRVVETMYGNLKLNAVESTECWFTDMLIEQSQTDANGDCIIWFDNKFLQTVNTSYKYKVDVTPIGEFASNGKLTYVRVVEKTEKYFKVRGTPNTLFDWTITAKQKGYERDRLEKAS